MKVKVKDNENLVRDTRTKAVINADLSSLAQYKQRRNALLKKDNEMETLKNEVSQLKAIVQELLSEKNK